MSDEYSVTTNFQRESDNPRAEGEFMRRMARVREREAERDAAAERLLCWLDAEATAALASREQEATG